MKRYPIDFTSQWGTFVFLKIKFEGNVFSNGENEHPG
jgi:hypothetical protein